MPHKHHQVKNVNEMRWLEVPLHFKGENKKNEQPE